MFLARRHVTIWQKKYCKSDEYSFYTIAKCVTIDSDDHFLVTFA